MNYLFTYCAYSLNGKKTHLKEKIKKSRRKYREKFSVHILVNDKLIKFKHIV